MLRGLYTAASGMITEQRRHDTVTQNIANINTPGYKQMNSVSRAFPEMLVSLVGDSTLGTRRIGKLNTGVFVEESLPSYMQGDLTETGKNSDFALISNINLDNPATGEPIPFDASGKYVTEDGEIIYRPAAFFSVMDTGGNVRYTRDGSFYVDPDGALRTMQGYQVLDSEGNAIVLGYDQPIDSLQIDPQGNLQINGEAIEVQMGISVVTRPQALFRDGNGVYLVQDEEAAGIRALQEDDAVQVQQGYIEGSNVNLAQSMVDMMAAQRAYESNQKMIQFYDKSLEKAVNEIGRV
ncbi:flagellar hook-basal body protein [Paenibacillus woosongensis]|uniref:Flagellar hook-basal body protein n=1 Tax=Paenibacillus woosongensis TaxID=307580 RepID=A0AA95KTD9_9BACL|nr:flagellar hook-basal body protein [Paenibacillus woosongensis]WHX48758.1 flagellar hook-basal body protein [Paenibacillus woosongensis]